MTIGSLDRLPASMIVCNCARCGRLLRSPRNTGDNERDIERFPPFIAGRLFGRPYCEPCAAREIAEFMALHKDHDATLDRCVRCLRGRWDCDDRSHRVIFDPPGRAALYGFDLDDVVKSLEES